MDGNRTQMALNGAKVVKLNDLEYDINLSLNDMRDYMRYMKKNVLVIQFASEEKDIEKVLKLQEEIDDYKLNFAQKLLRQGGMDKKEAEILIVSSCVSFMRDGVLDEWLGFTTEDSKKKEARITELKN